LPIVGKWDCPGMVRGLSLGFTDDGNPPGGQLTYEDLTVSFPRGCPEIKFAIRCGRCFCGLRAPLHQRHAFRSHQRTCRRRIRLFFGVTPDPQILSSKDVEAGPRETSSFAILRTPTLESSGTGRAATTGYAATKGRVDPARKHRPKSEREPMARTLEPDIEAVETAKRCTLEAVLTIPDEIGQQDETTNHQYSNPTPKIAAVPFQDPPTCAEQPITVVQATRLRNVKHIRSDSMSSRKRMLHSRPMYPLLAGRRLA
jgi:hypothetical protein